MTANLSLNLQLLQGISDMSANNSNMPRQNNEPAVYAKEGDPNYNEEMDADKDGIVTMEEYQKYCEANNINTEEEQIQTVQNKVDAMLERNTSSSEQENSFSYDEYMEYCEQNQSAGAFSSSAEIKHEDAGLVIRNIGKALNSYSGININLPEIKVERNA